MNALTDKEFLEFFESFNERTYEEIKKGKSIIHKCYDSITELSRSDSYPYDALLTNPFPMYGLDWMVKSSDKWDDYNLPKSVDALFVKKSNEGNLVLHVIEFKFIKDESKKTKLNNLYMNIIEKNNRYMLNKSKSDLDKKEKRCFDNDFVNDFKEIKNAYIDEIENSLQLKPYEAIYIALPKLYEEYCEKNNRTKKDFRGYLSNMEKYYWVCLDSGSPNGSNVHAQAQQFERYYKRMEPVIFVKAVAKNKKDFEVDLKDHILSNIYAEG